MILNTHRRPFSNLARTARRSRSHSTAARWSQIAGGSDFAAPTCQLLPPGLPRLQALLPVHCAGPGPDAGRRPTSRAPARTSRALGRAAPCVRMITTDQTPDFGSQNLEIGGDACASSATGSPSSTTRPTTPTSARSSSESQHIDAVVNGWIQDYPAPSNFFSADQLRELALHVQRRINRQLARDERHRRRRSGSNDAWTPFDRTLTDRRDRDPIPQPEGCRLRLEAARELPASSRVRPAGRPGLGAVTGGEGRRRASRMPARISTPPATCIAVIDSDSRITAKIAATNGCRFGGQRRPRRADPVERAEPEHVRQHERAERPRRRRAARRRAQVPVLARRLRRADDREAPAPSRAARARSPGRASSSPSAARSAPSSRPTSPRSTTASRIAAQARRRPRRRRRSRRARRRRTRRSRRARTAPPSCSRPSARPNSAAKIGVAPRIRPTVDAVVRSSE